MSSFSGKVAIITGASSGLGLALAEAFARDGARVVMVARGTERLQQAAATLRAAGHEVLPIVADVTRDDDVRRLMEQTVAEWGRIDILVNNAGISQRGAVLETTPEQFAELMELNLLAVVRCTRAASEQLLAHGGYIVNIGSLAGKSAARWLGAYPASKFAVTAYSQQLRLELGPRGVHVLLVISGPIRRPDGEHRYDAQAEALPPEARKPGGGVKVSAIDPTELARRVVQACHRREPELIVPAKARLLFVLSALSARLGDWLVLKNTSS